MEFIKKKHTYLAKTFYGLEGVLAEELRAIGAQDVEEKTRAVLFTGDKEVLYKANLYTRTSLRILMVIYEGKASSEDDLYKLAYRFKWEDLFSVQNTFAVDCVVKSQQIQKSIFATFKVKDAIVDRFRHQSGRRPNVEIERPDYRVNVHIWDENVTFYLDSTCEPLFKRGYRYESEHPPLNEVLAAGMLKHSGWDGKTALMDPMCGTGTILIEAAMIATNTVPGLIRKYYGFKNWSDFDSNLYRRLIDQAKKQVVEPTCHLYGRDSARKVISVATKNIASTGFSDIIKLKVSPFEKGSKPEDKGVIVSSPPAGDEDNLEETFELYEKFGQKLESEYTDWKSWFIFFNKPASKRIGVYADKHITLYEGSDECWFNGYFLEDNKSEI